MKTFMIYTEDKNRARIEEILGARLEDFTLLFGQGFWVGAGNIYHENSLVIMVLTKDEEVIRDLAREIKRVNQQESVLVTSFETKGEMI